MKAAKHTVAVIDRRLHRRLATDIDMRSLSILVLCLGPYFLILPNIFLIVDSSFYTTSRKIWLYP